MEPKQGGSHPHLSPHGSEHMLLDDGVHIRACVVIEIVG